jgi:hypothetical protein
VSFSDATVYGVQRVTVVQSPSDMIISAENALHMLQVTLMLILQHLIRQALKVAFIVDEIINRAIHVEEMLKVAVPVEILQIVQRAIWQIIITVLNQPEKGLGAGCTHDVNMLLYLG